MDIFSVKWLECEFNLEKREVINLRMCGLTQGVEESSDEKLISEWEVG